MKKIVFGTFLVISFTFFCTLSCKNESDSESIPQYTSVETKIATETKSWSYSNLNKIFELDSSVLNVNISGDLGGKTLYYATVNPYANTINANLLRKIEDSNSISRSVVSSDIIDLDEVDLDKNSKKYFVGKKMPFFNLSNSRSASIPDFEKAIKNVSIGDTAQFYVDINADMTSYAKKNATCHAVGDYCNVWVVDDYYSNSSVTKGKKVDSSIVNTIKEKFDVMYPFITNVFGKESNEILVDNGSNEKIDLQSIAGTKINIVIYDLGNDYVDESKIAKNGIAGYFHSKDYYYAPTRKNVLQYSNGGKFFYIDSAYAVKSVNETISTLAHEFQHMLNFNKKDITSMKAGKRITPSSSYNEMLSMLCEDMMQEKLNLLDEESPKNRISQFNPYYCYSGITEYRNDSNTSVSYTSVSYANSYTFGAWLCRNYGGAGLIKAMIDNDKVDNDSIVDAVNSVNGTSYSFGDLFKQFILSLFSGSEFKNATQNLTYSGYSYPMKAFSLWSDDYRISNDSFQSKFNSVKADGYNWNGPFLFKNEIYNIELRPNYGIQLHKMGTYATETTSDLITFSKSGANSLRIYLVLN